MNIATDLEGTLTTGRTWRGVGKYLQATGRTRAWAYRSFMAVRMPVILLARTGWIDRQEYANRWIIDLARLLRGFDGAELARLSEFIVENEMWPQRRADVLAELEAHQAGGHRIILTSGTYVPVAEAFARRAGIGAAIGSPLHMVDGRASGEVEGTLNNKAVKADRLRQFLGAEHLDIAYGDTMADVPMLELAQQAIAVYPEEHLRKMALSRGWKIMESL